MSLRMVAAIVLSALLAVPSVAVADGAAGHGKNGGRRFHPWTDALRKRVKPTTRKRVDAAGVVLAPRYNWRSRPKGFNQTGSAFLVERSGNKGMVLTNAHVMREDEGVFVTTSRLVGGKVAFRLGDGGKPILAPITRLVLGARHIDFALVEVDLPPEAQKLEPMPLSKAMPAKGTRIYNAAFPGLGNVVRSAVAITGNNSHLFSPGDVAKPRDSDPAKAPKVLQTGVVTSKPIESKWGTRWTRTIIHTDHPVYKGSSGSAVIDRETHRVVGLATLQLEAKNTRDKGFKRPTFSFKTGVIPLPPVLGWIGEKLEAGKIAPDLRDRVSALLRAAE